MGGLPEVVAVAEERARAAGFAHACEPAAGRLPAVLGYACEPAVGRSPAVLAARLPADGRVLEIHPGHAPRALTRVVTTARSSG
ncbi:hypothetical protein [Nonomuraea roseoviolacea]|uniref:Uncharacterized protein n=1 Tax=Nonomuraea roseoviolacea subsp. carminata TaxID=160689 RepID=A0ABT1K9Z4_9ACTN|nr:hypothetical protein [Nonomuraea roseoviolacea]MCP2350407.1 hypothetical protein [Nonomuraea roseoviolacea subsp. carminata]